MSDSIASSNGHLSSLGARVHAFRISRRMSLRELAARAGTSASFLSKLERGTTGASIGTLMQVADAMGVSVSAFFEPHGASLTRVISAADRPTLSTDHGLLKTLVSQHPIRTLEAYCGLFSPGGSTGDELYTHGDAHELLFVVAGRIQLLLDDAVHELARGDSIEYRTSVPHGLFNRSGEEAEVLWIISPPTITGPAGHTPSAVTTSDPTT